MSEDLVTRNMRALVEAAKADRVRVDILTEQLRLANQAIAGLSSDIGALRTQIIGLLARSAGNGRTA